MGPQTAFGEITLAEFDRRRLNKARSGLRVCVSEWVGERDAFALVLLVIWGVRATGFDGGGVGHDWLSQAGASIETQAKIIWFMFRPSFIDHLVFRVAELGRSESFYNALLGEPDYRGDDSIMYEVGTTRLFFTLSTELQPEKSGRRPFPRVLCPRLAASRSLRWLR